MVRVLLLKEARNKQHTHYIHSNITYIQYDYCFSVNKDNLVTGYRSHNNYLTPTVESLKEFSRQSLGLTQKQYEKKLLDLKEENKYFILHSLKFIPLNKPYDILSKTVRGLRFASTDETHKCCLLLVQDMFNNEDVMFGELLYGSPRLSKVYGKCMELDIISEYFDYIDGERV